MKGNIQNISMKKDWSLKIRPNVDADLVKKIALKCFGLKISNDKSDIKELDSYDDRNYVLTATQDHPEESMVSGKFIMKLFNASETKNQSWYNSINNMVTQASKQCFKEFKLPVPILNIQNNNSSILYNIPLKADVIFCETTAEDLLQNKFVTSSKDGIIYVQHMVRLTSYIPGKTINVKEMDSELAFSYGKCSALLSLSMEDFSPPEMDIREEWLWNVLYTSKLLPEPYVSTIKDDKRRAILLKILHEYDEYVAPKLPNLSKQWIHGDLNDQNLLESGNEISGIVDFDDSCYSYRIIDLATMLMYITGMSSRECCVTNARIAYKGYASVITLDKVEMDILFKLVLVRYVQSLTLAEYQYTYIDPGNEYLLITQKQGWEILNYLLEIGEVEFMERIRND